MIRTLVEPKKTVIASIRSKLLSKGLEEEVEYDSINIEPVLIYSLSNERRVFVKHKWETVVLVRLNSREDAKDIVSGKENSFQVEENEQDGTVWARFLLPDEEDAALKLFSRTITNSSLIFCVLAKSSGK